MVVPFVVGVCFPKIPFSLRFAVFSFAHFDRCAAQLECVVPHTPRNIFVNISRARPLARLLSDFRILENYSSRAWPMAASNKMDCTKHQQKLAAILLDSFVSLLVTLHVEM